MCKTLCATSYSIHDGYIPHAKLELIFSHCLDIIFLTSRFIYLFLFPTLDLNSFVVVVVVVLFFFLPCLPSIQAPTIRRVRISVSVVCVVCFCFFFPATFFISLLCVSLVFFVFIIFLYAIFLRRSWYCYRCL